MDILENKLERADRWLARKRKKKQPDRIAQYRKLKPHKRRMVFDELSLKDFGLAPLFCTGCTSYYYPKELCACED